MANRQITNKIEKILTSLDHIPTTRLRVLATICLIAATGVKYLIHACEIRTASGVCLGWEPSINWLIFLSALAGVDVTQYFAKSFTDIKTNQINKTINTTMEELPSEINDDSTATTDVSEIKNEKG